MSSFKGGDDVVHVNELGVACVSAAARVVCHVRGRMRR